MSVYFAIRLASFLVLLEKSVISSRVIACSSPGVITYRKSFEHLCPLPCVHNHTVTLNGDSATGSCSVEIRMVQNGEAITAAGHYEDTFRRVGAEWKFAHRNLKLYHQVPHLKGWA